MIVSVHQAECLSMHLFRLLVLALMAQHIHQVVHAHQCRRILSTRSLTHFLEMKCPNLIPFPIIDLGHEKSHTPKPQNQDSRL
jgi:hypothetical protein